jgi:hypothetical protein
MGAAPIDCQGRHLPREKKERKKEKKEGKSTKKDEEEEEEGKFGWDRYPFIFLKKTLYAFLFVESVPVEMLSVVWEFLLVRSRDEWNFKTEE